MKIVADMIYCLFMLLLIFKFSFIMSNTIKKF